MVGGFIDEPAPAWARYSPSVTAPTETTDNPPWLIVGTGGFATELIDVLRGDGHSIGGVVGPRPVKVVMSAQWLGDDEVLAHQPSGSLCYVAVGDPKTRQRLSALALDQGLVLVSFVHSTAWVAASAQIGPGVCVYPHATVHANVVLARGVVVNSNASVGHETSIGEFSNLGPGVSVGGCCRIEALTYLGIGATTLDNVTICGGTVVGAGATVVCDLELPGCYVGTPARALAG